MENKIREYNSVCI